MNTYPPPNMANPRPNILRIILLILAIAIVITTVALIILNILANQEKSKTPLMGIFDDSSDQTYEDGYRDGYNAAREKLSGQFGGLLNEEIQSVSGSIESISGNQFQVLVKGLDTDEFVDGVSDTRTILITPETQIIIQTPLSPEEEAMAFKEAMESTVDEPILLPNPFKQSTGTINDLEEGMDVLIRAEKNIRLEAEFEASKIYIQIRN